MVKDRNWYREVVKTELTYEMAKELAVHCADRGIEFFASAFDTERVRWLEDLGVQRHKIACRLYNDELLDWEDGEIGDTVRAMCDTGKPIIVSCPYGATRPILPTTAPVSYLFCVPEYPAPFNTFHLGQVQFDRSRAVGSEVWDGISDHSGFIYPSQIAIAKGAQLVEVHFSFNKLSRTGPDHTCSIEPSEVADLIPFATAAELIL
jgi:N,N'-diacetyllegionaminate synthase